MGAGGMRRGQCDDRPMHVLLLTHYYAAHGGGVEIVAHQIARRLVRDHGFSVTWLAAAVDPPPAEPGLHTTPLPAWNPLERRLGLPYPLLKPSGLAALWRAVGACDVIHIHECQYQHAWIGTLFARLRRKPFIVTQHVGEVEYRSPLKRAALRVLNAIGRRWVLDRAVAVLFVSARVMEFFRAQMRHPETARWVENGVDTEIFQPLDEAARRATRALHGVSDEGRLVAFAGRFVEKKGLHLIEALARHRADATFVLAGQGPIDPTRWNLPNVKVVGMLDAQQLARLYNAANVLCLPSFGEGFPLVVQEAMACSCPPVLDRGVTAGGQIPDELTFTFDTLAPDAPSQALSCLDAALSESPSARQRRRNRNAAYALSRWSWHRCATEHAEVLHATASRHSHQGS